MNNNHDMCQTNNIIMIMMIIIIQTLLLLLLLLLLILIILLMMIMTMIMNILMIIIQLLMIHVVITMIIMITIILMTITNRRRPSARFEVRLFFALRLLTFTRGFVGFYSRLCCFMGCDTPSHRGVAQDSCLIWSWWNFLAMPLQTSMWFWRPSVHRQE